MTFTVLSIAISPLLLMNARQSHLRNTVNCQGSSSSYNLLELAVAATRQEYVRE